MEEVLLSRQRSLTSPQLRDLRLSQMAEQSQFLRSEADQYHLMLQLHSARKHELLSGCSASRASLDNHHADILASLEHRHLCAEADLRRTFALERQACETRLRHMEAYCNPDKNVKGMPVRAVTKQDLHQLQQQYHVRDGMDNLHAARINVLREKQAKQLERITARQQSELDTLAREHEDKSHALEQTFRQEEQDLGRELSERKHRMITRWNLMEAIERRTLENRTGDAFAALPPIAWGERMSVIVEPDGFDAVPSSQEIMKHDGRGFACEAMMAYNAAMLDTS